MAARVTEILRIIVPETGRRLLDTLRTREVRLSGGHRGELQARQQLHRAQRTTGTAPWRYPVDHCPAKHDGNSGEAMTSLGTASKRGKMFWTKQSEKLD